MAITINGGGTITGISAGGLPDGSVTAADIESTLDLSSKTVTLPAGTGGKVLQVVSSQTISTTFINSTSFVDTGLSVSITPSSASNKVLVLMGYYISQDDSDGAQAVFNVVRTIGGTSTQIYESLLSQDANTGQVFAQAQVSYLDSPNTTSTVTYKSQGKTNNSSSDFRPRSASVVLMEIAG